MSNKHKTGEELNKETRELLKTFRDYLAYLDNLPQNETRDSLILYFEERVSTVKNGDNSLVWTMTPEKARKFLEWESRNQ